MPMAVAGGGGSSLYPTSSANSGVADSRGLNPPLRHQPTGPNLTPFDAERLQAALADFAKQFLGCPFLTGKLLTVAFEAGETSTIKHGLGRTAIGWWVCDVDAFGTPTRVSMSDTDIKIYWDSAKDANAKVWVF